MKKIAKENQLKILCITININNSYSTKVIEKGHKKEEESKNEIRGKFE